MSTHGKEYGDILLVPAETSMSGIMIIQFGNTAIARCPCLPNGGVLLYAPGTHNNVVCETCNKLYVRPPRLNRSGREPSYCLIKDLDSAWIEWWTDIYRELIHIEWDGELL